MNNQQPIVSQAIPYGCQTADGRWWWDGQAWQPMQEVETMVRTHGNSGFAHVTTVQRRVKKEAEVLAKEGWRVKDTSTWGIGGRRKIMVTYERRISERQ